MRNLRPTVDCTCQTDEPVGVKRARWLLRRANPHPEVLALTYVPASARYDTMTYRRCGRSGLKLPAVSLGLWHNFGGDSVFENMREMCRTAFDLGITHFDLANNYGP